MKIGELAKITGTAVETVRFYEREGLLPAARRSAGNYRLYDDSHVRRLAFIRQCRSLDMALDEVRELLGFKDQPDSDCGRVNRLLDDHIDHVVRRVRELGALEQELRALRARCDGPTNGPTCGILAQLDAETRAETASPPARRPRHLRGAH